MERKYKFTRDAYVMFVGKKVAEKGFEFTHDLAKSRHVIIKGCSLDLLDAIQDGFIIEILPNEKPNILPESDSTNPYGRQIYLAEAIHALANHDVLIKDKYDYVWHYDKIDETFYTYGEDGYTTVITEKYTVKEILEFQFDVIPKSEKTKQKWIEISCSKELCNAISNGKTIRVGNGIPMDKYNDKQITTLFGTLNQGIVKLEYLEEN